MTGHPSNIGFFIFCETEETDAGFSYIPNCPTSATCPLRSLLFFYSRDDSNTLRLFKGWTGRALSAYKSAKRFI